MRFRANPIDVDAVQFTGKNHDELRALEGADVARTGNSLCLHTAGGTVHVRPGDWVVVAPTVAPIVVTALSFPIWFEAIPEERGYAVESDERYDDAYAKWIASGRRGPPPPRPVRPHIPGPTYLTEEH